MLSIPLSVLISNIDAVYARFKALKLSYTQSNLEVREAEEVVLPLGFRVYYILEEYI